MNSVCVPPDFGLRVMATGHSSEGVCQCDLCLTLSRVRDLCRGSSSYFFWSRALERVRLLQGEILDLRDRDHWLTTQPPAATPPGTGGVGGAPSEGASPAGARAPEGGPGDLAVPLASDTGSAAEAAGAKEAGEERVKEKKKKKKEEKKEKDRKRKRSRSSRGKREESVEVTKSPGGKELKKGREEFPWHQVGGSVGVKEEPLRAKRKKSVQGRPGIGPPPLRCHQAKRKKRGGIGALRVKGTSGGLLQRARKPLRSGLEVKRGERKHERAGRRRTSGGTSAGPL